MLLRSGHVVPFIVSAQPRRLFRPVGAYKELVVVWKALHGAMDLVVNLGVLVWHVRVLLELVQLTCHKRFVGTLLVHTVRCCVGRCVNLEDARLLGELGTLAHHVRARIVLHEAHQACQRVRVEHQPMMVLPVGPRFPNVTLQLLGSLFAVPTKTCSRVCRVSPCHLLVKGARSSGGCDGWTNVSRPVDLVIVRAASLLRHNGRRLVRRQRTVLTTLGAPPRRVA
mmetsp:Transcript_1808/g.5774  ORF Transcript_1808/g.5774 Transcript_1808/m.5774 type:complete len:225 (+) Transcript_1808:357-1031(+)